MNKQERFEQIQVLCREVTQLRPEDWHVLPNTTNDIINSLTRAIDRFKDEV